MQVAQRSLQQASAAFAKVNVAEDHGDLILSSDVLELDQGDTERRVFAAAIRWISGAANRPRFAALKQSAAALRQGKQTTLNGVLMTPEAENIRLCREYSAVVNVQSVIDCDGRETVWDGRWCIRNRDQYEWKGGFAVRSLGEEGLAKCENWRASGLPRRSLLASPSVWVDGTLIAAPLAENANGWDAFIPMKFADSLLSH
jgi:tRNA(Ile)-lysidine synthase